MSFLIAYDIANPRRLRRVARRIERDAVRQQKSIFLFHGTRSALQTLVDALVELIEPDEDRLDVWLLSTSTPVLSAGVNAAPATDACVVCGSTPGPDQARMTAALPAILLAGK